MKMNASSRILVAGGIAAAVLAGCATMSGPPTTFFITSTNPAQSGNLGGLAGADAICEQLAAAAGVGGRNWRAYLSTQAVGGAPVVNARDRIGNGPWTNAKGVVIARNLAELHGTNNINKETALTEKGEIVPARPDPVNAPRHHDRIATGRHRHAGRSRCDVQQLDQQHHGRRHGGPPQPRRHQPRPGGQCVVELLAHHAGLRHAVAAEGGRGGAVLLLCGEVTVSGGHGVPTLRAGLADR